MDMNNNKHMIMTTTRSLLTAALLGTAFLAQAASPVVIDNTDAGFSVIGTWPTSTAVTGYQGSNYQNHEANGSPPGAIVVDNTDAGFTVTGTWPTSTSVGGYLGANYQVHSANGEEPSAIVVDNLAGTFTGSWGASTSVSGYFGTNYQAQAAGSGANSFTWTPSIPNTGSYKVYARWTAHPNRSTHAVYTVNHAGGATTVTVNQEANGGTWQLLGTFTLNSGTGNTVVLVDQGDGYVIADAIKVLPDGAAPNTATWTPTIPSSGSYKVYTRWTAHPNRATDAKYTVTHAGGNTLVTVDQEQNNGSWVLLGTFSMAPSSGHKVSLTDQANGYVIADAIRLLDAASPEFNMATWTPSTTAGQYEVYAKWTANPNRATNATYTVNHAQGSTQVSVNQQSNGGSFNLLGTFNLNSSSTVTLSDNANGYVIADAIQLIPLTTISKMYFVHTDHLNTPRLITSDIGQAVWRWNNDDPYGNNAPDQNPSGAGQFTCNLRLPGQYFDMETNSHYNYYRDYDPLTGRYVQSDPIGLAGGINTFGYVEGNPLGSTDMYGLFPSAPTIFTGLAKAVCALADPVVGVSQWQQEVAIREAMRENQRNLDRISNALTVELERCNRLYSAECDKAAKRKCTDDALAQRMAASASEYGRHDVAMGEVLKVPRTQAAAIFTKTVCDAF